MADKSGERRLAAILSADIVGYSRLVGLDEEGTLARVNAHRREFLEPTVADHRGRIVKRTGDGALIDFNSAVDAVRCAIQVQRGMAQRNATVPDEQRIQLRIGIHLGDILLEEGDIFGDGVNVAVRLESIAPVGGICISDDVYRQVRAKVDVDFRDIGKQTLKNIIRPIHVYQYPMDAVTAATHLIELVLPDRPSIAVLPFQNMSGDPEQEYFADGMVDEIITSLSRIQWLIATSRTSTFAFKGQNADIRDIARKLSVRYVLEGSVRKAGNRVRIIGQLIDAASGAHIWADRVEGLLDDIFELQDRVTECVVGAIEPKLRYAEIERAKRKRPENMDAYDYYLRALPAS